MSGARLVGSGNLLYLARTSIIDAALWPAAAAFHVLKNVYLTMHGDNLKLLLATPGAQYRLFAGFSGWAPRQLESEFMRDGWYVLPADEAMVFRKDADGLWEELVERARRRGPRAHNSGVTMPAKWFAP